MGRHTQKEEEMVMTGGEAPSAIVPKEEQAGVDMIPHGGNPAEGRDLGAAENMIDTARAGEAQVARSDQQGKGKTQTAAQCKQGRSRPRRAPRAAPERQGASTDLDNGAGTEEGEGPVLSNPGQRAPRMDKKKMAAFPEREGIKGGRKSRVMAGILLMLESMNQPAPELESSVPTVAVGVLLVEKPKDVSQWRCKVLTCSESYHPLEQCQLFLQMSAVEIYTTFLHRMIFVV